MGFLGALRASIEDLVEVPVEPNPIPNPIPNQALAVAGLAVVGRQTFGVFPVRGKPPNATLPVALALALALALPLPLPLPHPCP